MDIVTDEKRLREPCRFVEEGEDISLIVADLFREMDEHLGGGLAAPQLGYDVRVFVMWNILGPPICIVNALVVKEKGGNEVRLERCLSLPGIAVKVKRPMEVVIKGFNQFFKPVRYRFRDGLARIALHELDHCCGRLITDYNKGGGRDETN